MLLGPTQRQAGESQVSQLTNEARLKSSPPYRGPFHCVIYTVLKALFPDVCHTTQRRCV